MSGLPEEIIEENILTRLPVKSISRFRCVSKTWHLLFQNPNFIRKHLNHANLMNKFNILVTNSRARFYSIDYDVLSSSSPFLGHALEIDVFLPRIIGSCNGLVCLKQPLFNKGICIWNPATNEYAKVPEAPISAGSHFGWCFAYGFGFDCKNDDYKILSILSFGNGKQVSEASIYSLASNSWKNLGSVPYSFCFHEIKGFLLNGVLLNGVLHWMAVVHQTGLESTSVLVMFDISDETFRHVPLPDNNSIKDPFMLDLGIWEGKLCLLRRNHMEDPVICTHGNDHIDVWTMMDNKWSKHLKITAHVTDMFYLRPIQSLQNGEILLEGRPRREVGAALMSYDPNRERARDLKIHGFPEQPEVEIYIETLVSLNSGTYAGRLGNNKKSNK